MDHRIRAYAARDAAALATLFHRSVEGLAQRAYTPDQVAAWSARGGTPEETHARCTDGRAVFVAVDARDRPIAFTDLEPDGHVDMLFCLPEAEGTGAAHAAYRAMEAHARSSGIARLFTEASELARPFFERQGFRVLRRRDFEIGAGVEIHNYAMEKRLDAGG